MALGILLISVASASIAYGAWSNGAKTITIVDGHNAGFAADLFTPTDPASMTINVKLYDSAGTLLHAFEDNRVVNSNSFSSNYIVDRAKYLGSGTFQVILSASDSLTGTQSDTLTLNVNPNTPSVITSTPVLSVNEGQYYSYQVVATDVDTSAGDVLTYSLTGNPAWLSIDSTGLVLGTAPLVTSNQSFSVTVNVFDGINTVTQNYNLLVVDSSAGDTTAPTVTISNPVNGTLYNSIQTILNYNANDTEGNLYQCWYSFDDGVTNSTATSCSGEFAGLASTQGSNTWTIYASDTAGNIGTDSVTFTVDSIAPIVAITSPTAGATINGDEAIVFTDSELTNAQCSVDNATWNNCTSGTTPISALAGFSAIINGNAFTLYLRDTDAAGNIGTDSVSLVKNINVDAAAPIVTITFPTATDYDEEIDEIRYTATDSNLQSCWYSLNNGLTNSTATNCTGRFTGLDSRNGFNTWTVYARDSFGNIGSKSVAFFINSDKDTAKIVYQDPDEQKYLQQASGTPTAISPVVDLTGNISENIFAKMLNAIINFLKALFGFN